MNPGITRMNQAVAKTHAKLKAARGAHERTRILREFYQVAFKQGANKTLKSFKAINLS